MGRVGSSIDVLVFETAWLLLSFRCGAAIALLIQIQAVGRLNALAMAGCRVKILLVLYLAIILLESRVSASRLLIVILNASFEGFKWLWRFQIISDKAAIGSGSLHILTSICIVSVIEIFDPLMLLWLLFSQVILNVDVV